MLFHWWDLSHQECLYHFKFFMIDLSLPNSRRSHLLVSSSTNIFAGFSFSILDMWEGFAGWNLVLWVGNNVLMCWMLKHVQNWNFCLFFFNAYSVHCLQYWTIKLLYASMGFILPCWERVVSIYQCTTVPELPGTPRTFGFSDFSNLIAETSWAYDFKVYKLT